MGAEEVLSVRAGSHSRPKRRGQDRVNLRQSSKIVLALGGSNGGGAGNEWLGAAHGRTDGRQGQRNAPGRGPLPHQKSTSHGGTEARIKRRLKPHQRSVSAVVANVASAGRSADNTFASRTGGGGGSSIGVGGLYGGGDGSVGHAVHTAAVENVEIFLGDFVPNVQQPPAVATLLAAGGEEKGGGGEGSTSVGGAVVKKLSKWAAIGRGGKISARATAVCIEEVRVRMPIAGCVLSPGAVDASRLSMVSPGEVEQGQRKQNTPHAIHPAPATPQSFPLKLNALPLTSIAG